MLWRASRATVFLESIEFPTPVSDGVWIGSLGLLGLREAAIWKKLFETSGYSVRIQTALVAQAWDPISLKNAQSAFAPSELASTHFWEDPEGKWASQIGPDSVTFVALVSEGQPLLAVAGGPTDEAWDRFEAALASWG